VGWLFELDHQTETLKPRFSAFRCGWPRRASAPRGKPFAIAVQYRNEVPASATRAVALALDGVGKRYQGETGETIALADVSFTIARGEFVSVIGPSGCGKSTLFNIIGGLIEDYDGAVLLDGKRIAGPHPQIAMVFQEESTFPWRTTLENVAFGLEIRGVPRAEREARANAILDLVGLHGFADRRPGELSGGMRQRTALARALCAEPEILLMDEPFAALDEQTRLLLGEKLLEIWERLQQTTLLITHSIAEAVQLSDRVVVLSYRPGRIKQIVEIDLRGAWYG
jgi:NitT/TauT family transport system ATP-binding protein